MEENLDNPKENIDNKKINKEANDIEFKDNKENNQPLELEEDEIYKEDINNIVDYLSNLDYEKYSRDMEIKEALMILKTKMDKEQENKEKENEIQNEKIKIIEDKNLTIYKDRNNDNKENIIKEENTININKYQNNENDNIESNEIKEPKEIIDEEEVKKKEKIEKYKLAEKIAKTSALKDVHSVQSVQKLLLRENLDDQAPLKISIIKENPLASCDGYVPNKLPFLRSLPLV